MEGQVSMSIITNKDIANQITIATTTLGHRFCLWHILKKLQENLDHIQNLKPSRVEYDINYVYDWLIMKDIENSWKTLLGTYNVTWEYVWLKWLYDDRHTCVLAYVKTTF